VPKIWRFFSTHFVVNAPPPFVGPEWAELPSDYFAVQRVVNPTWLPPHVCCILSCVKNICVTVYSYFLIGVNWETGKGDSVKVMGA
jgi:hypothetical protein